MANLNLKNTVKINSTDGILIFPSESQFNPTSSNPSTAATIEIRVTPNLGNSIISDSENNPFIRIPLLSSSNVDQDFDQELVLRFFTGSHFFESNTSSIAPAGGGFNVKDQFRNLYYTGSSGQVIEFRDRIISQSITSSDFRNVIHDLITGSSFHSSGLISASKIGSTTSSLTYTQLKGLITSPIAFTGSLHATASFSALTTVAGVGALNFVENPRVLSKASASLNIAFGSDSRSIVFSQGTSSLGYAATARPNNTFLFFSASGKMGVGTDTPKAKFEVSGSVKVKKIKTVSTGSTGRSIILEGDRVKFFESTELNPDAPV